MVGEWTGNSTDFLPATGVNTFQLNLTTNHILINLRNARNGYSHGVYRSTDGGTHLAKVFLTPKIWVGGLIYFKILKCVSSSKIMSILLTSNGVYKSKDNLTT